MNKADMMVDSTALGLYNGHLEVVQALLGAEADANKAAMVVRLHCTVPPRWALGSGAGSAGRGG